MAKHARTTISVPADLKARMDAVDEPVNWSAVACKAFEFTLADIIKRKGAKNVSDAIQRLRASKRKSDDEYLKLGREAGEAWAKESAEAEELYFLEDFNAKVENDSRGWDGVGADSRYSIAELVAFATGGGDPDECDRDYPEAFWRDYGGAERRREFVIGFVEGALDFWNQVKDDL